MKDYAELEKRLRSAAKRTPAIGGAGLELVEAAAAISDLTKRCANPSQNDDPEDVAELLSSNVLGSLKELCISGPGVPFPHEDFQLRWFGCIEDAPRMGGYAVRATDFGRLVNAAREQALLSRERQE